jgi:hypothetical protein
MSEHKNQHHVIIDGHELTPLQSNHVVEAIESQLGNSLDDMFDSDVDPYQKQTMAPAVRSLAEVLYLVAPHILFDGIEVIGGKAHFDEELEEFNPGGTEEVIYPKDE